MPPAERKVLDFYDVLLRQGDIDLLTGSEWLNDQIMAFAFEYWQREVYPPSILLVSGAVTYLLLSAGRDLAAAVLDPLHFATRKLTLFCVNNNPDAQSAGGGSHWSLACFSSEDKTFRHYDSSSGHNARAARPLFQALQPVLPPGARYLEESAAQQQNAYDCGLYALLAAELLCERFIACGGSSSSMQFAIDDAAIPPAAATDMRARWHRLILQKAEQAGAAGSSTPGRPHF